MPPTQAGAARPRGGIRGLPPRWRWAGISGLSLLAAASWVAADWWTCLPADTQAAYVGRGTCAECHQGEVAQWTGSHHDLAMDCATPETVLGDFHDATLEHDGITSTMFRRDGRYMIRTEGPDGELDDFEIKYVFGVDPLQQYMVEFDRPPGLPDDQVARLQVLRVSWDALRKQWFYLRPPDVREKLAPDDPLHWTGAAQNWNHMCAACHSTDLRKNFELETRTYHTTFSEIDVSCEACHGPGSVHVQLARQKSLFWDRRLGYGLPRLKSADPSVEIQACAPCHSRRSVVYPDYCPGDNYYDHFFTELIRPGTYYADGQIRDEVYEYGSFLQSKMHEKGIRCTDCHQPHTARLRMSGNDLCTSCHQHPAAKYDTPAHHRHNVGSSGAQCVECHMPATPFMEIDFRRDHSLRVPRPGLSVELGTPNACTGCHVDPAQVSSAKAAALSDYSRWLAAARAGDQEVRDELARLDRWAADWVRKWYGGRPADPPSFAPALAAAWEQEPAALPTLAELARNRRAAAIVRASTLEPLGQYAAPEVVATSLRALTDPDPQVRASAVANLEDLPRRQLLDHLAPLLDDPRRLVRIGAARALAHLPNAALTPAQQQAREQALADLERGLLADADQAGAQLSLGMLAERRSQLDDAEQAYCRAIHVQPGVSGPRTNLAALLEARGQADEAAQLRRDELRLLARDVRLLPSSAALQYRYGLALYLQDRQAEALAALEEACRLEPRVPDFRLALTLLYQKQQRWPEALNSAEQLSALRPDDPTYRQLREEIRQQSGGEAGPPLWDLRHADGVAIAGAATE